MLKSKDLLGLKDVSKEEIELILQTSGEMIKILDQNVKKVPHLQGKSIATLFYENSTRTKLSFENAAKFMSASVSSVSIATSSVAKGETLIDTGKTMDALLTDIIIIRHSCSGAPHLLAQNIKAGVINGGDGMNEHPTQALLDMLTMQELFGSLKGLNVVIAGDAKHSRVAKSNIWGLTKMGANVKIVSPKTLMPIEVEKMGAKVYTDFDKAIVGANVVMGLRLQLERQKAGLLPGLDEYSQFYGITNERLKKADKNVFVMHPGPINRGVEIESDVADATNSVIERQVTNGVAVRMALLFLLTRKSAS